MRMGIPRYPCIFMAFLATFAFSSARPLAEDQRNLTLVYVNVLWRHGDRSPTGPFAGDKINESQWTEGGGGYGQLSTRGMAQHVRLGALLRRRYVSTAEKTALLAQQYRSDEVYIRSTDVNRTLVSALSNLIGMFSQPENGNMKGRDLPKDLPVGTAWPVNFVPIPIHTVDDATDSIGNPSVPCKRRNELWKLVKDSPEFVDYNARPFVKKTFDFLSSTLNKKYSMDNMFEIADGMYIEKLYFNSSIPTLYPWYPRIADNIEIINDKAQEFKNGLILPLIHKKIEVGTEIIKTRGGSLIRLVNDYISMKIDCIDGKKECKTKFKNLKYFAISAHDTTLAAFLATLGAKDYVPRAGGYPHYAAAVINELWRDPTNGSYYIKFLYHRGAGEDGAGDMGADDVELLTNKVAGCPIDDDFCPLPALQERAAMYDPGDLEKLCATKPGEEEQGFKPENCTKGGQTASFSFLLLLPVGGMLLNALNN